MCLLSAFLNQQKDTTEWLQLWLKSASLSSQNLLVMRCMVEKWAWQGKVWPQMELLTLMVPHHPGAGVVLEEVVKEVLFQEAEVDTEAEELLVGTRPLLEEEPHHLQAPQPEVPPVGPPEAEAPLSVVPTQPPLQQLPPHMMLDTDRTTPMELDMIRHMMAIHKEVLKLHTMTTEHQVLLLDTSLILQMVTAMVKRMLQSPPLPLCAALPLALVRVLTPMVGHQQPADTKHAAFTVHNELLSTQQNLCLPQIILRYFVILSETETQIKM